jgi:hypothetical protein
MTESDHSKYLCFKEQAIARFLERFHVEPVKVFEFAWLLWVGPVPEEGTGDD